MRCIDRDLAIATYSSLHAPHGRALLFADPELEALYRAGCYDERPARILLASRAALRHLNGALNGAIARRAVL